MSPTPLHVIMHGLVAVVPTPDDQGTVNHLTALLVATQAADYGFDFGYAKHHPLVRIPRPGGGVCQLPFTSEGGYCEAPLDRHELRIAVEDGNGDAIDLMPPALQLATAAPRHALPFSPADAETFTYVANLSTLLGLDYDPALLSAQPPQTLAARMPIPCEEAVPCSLATRPDDDTPNVHAMCFRELHKGPNADDPQQAVAQMMVTTVQIPDGASVYLELHDLDGANVISVPITRDSDGAYKIELMNECDGVDLDDPRDDGVARDFAWLFDFARTPPSWEDRPIPHVKHTRWKSSKDVKVDAEDLAPSWMASSSRPICPMAGFNP